MKAANLKKYLAKPTAYGIRKYTERRMAFNSLDNHVKPARVILGDDGLHWVVCPALAEILYRAGYQYA